MVEASPLRVLVAGTDPWARRGLSDVLAAYTSLEIVGQTTLSGSLAAAIQLHRPNAVVVDSGPASAGRNRARGGAGLGGALTHVGGVPVLVLVADSEAASRAIASGAQGAISREGEPSRIAAALGAIDQGLLVLDERFRDLWPRGSGADELDVTLTARELEVLSLLAEGLSNKEIAAQLDISAHTAKFHVNAVLGKLDATTRTEAVTRAARHGLLRL